jgi:hypothetical protein
MVVSRLGVSLHQLASFESCQQNFSSGALPAAPKRARVAHSVPHDPRAAALAFGTTDTSPSPHHLLDRSPSCHTPGNPALTDSAAIRRAIVANTRSV